jgi:hypothetical protein
MLIAIALRTKYEHYLYTYNKATSTYRVLPPIDAILQRVVGVIEGDKLERLFRADSLVLDDGSRLCSLTRGSDSAA